MGESLQNATCSFICFLFSCGRLERGPQCGIETYELHHFLSNSLSTNIFIWLLSHKRERPDTIGEHKYNQYNYIISIIRKKKYNL